MGQAAPVGAGDPRLDDYRDLRDPAARVRYEDAHGTFVAEGTTVVRRLLESKLRVRSVLVLEGKEAAIADLVGPDVTFLAVDRATMRTVAGFDVHRGVLACAERPAAPSVAELAAGCGPTAVLAVLEGLNDHENLGAVARSASALGVAGLVLDPRCADPWYRRAVRVSMGELLRLPVARAGHWPADLDVLRAHGFEIIALTPADDAEPLADYASRRPARVALLLGAEGPGLSAGALRAADRRVRIPIRAAVDSLNVGHAAAIAFAALARPGDGPEGLRPPS